MVGLSKYTKAELIWLIDLACRFGLDEIYIVRAKQVLERERERKKLDEADRLSHLAHNKRMEYIELMRPYEGWKMKDIPMDVIRKADAAIQGAREADRKWRKLMMPKKTHPYPAKPCRTE